MKTPDSWLWAASRHTSVPATRPDSATTECWAVFDGTELQLRNRRPIELTDPDLKAVADQFGLRIF